MSTTFEMHRVTKVYGNRAALKNVSLTGSAGQVIALLGENGAGKTTAIKILLGLIPPDGGAARVLGMDSQAHGGEIRRRVGYMPDRPALYEWMTVEEIGWFAAGFHPIGYRQRYNELVRRFRLPAERPIKSLSKGMQGKVSLALAMAHEPQLLVLDEPTSGLDPLVRREFLESMVDVAAAGRTVLLSSHQIAEVERVADTIAIIREGRLVLCEPLEAAQGACPRSDRHNERNRDGAAVGSRTGVADWIATRRPDLAAAGARPGRRGAAGAGAGLESL